MSITVKGLGALAGHLERGQRDIKRKVTKAIRTTARKAVKPIRSRVPKAFGELSESIQDYTHGADGNPITAVTAPHASDVEIGTPPHKPDFEKLLAWVRLRGLQGLTKRGRLRKSFRKDQGPTTPYQARRISSMFRSLVVRGGKGAGRHSPADAAVQIAQAISRKIEKFGTKPHWYVQNSLPDIAIILDSEVRKELKS